MNKHKNLEDHLNSESLLVDQPNFTLNPPEDLMKILDLSKKHILKEKRMVNKFIILFGGYANLQIIERWISGN